MATPDWLRRMRGEVPEDPDSFGLSPTMSPRDAAYRPGRDDGPAINPRMDGGRSTVDMTGGLTPALEQIGMNGPDVLPIRPQISGQEMASLRPAFASLADRSGGPGGRPSVYAPAIGDALRGQADDAHTVLDGLDPAPYVGGAPPLRDITTASEEADLLPNAQKEIPGWVKALYIASETMGGIQAGMDGRQHRPGQSPNDRYREERERRISEIGRDRAEQDSQVDRQRQLDADTIREQLVRSQIEENAAQGRRADAQANREANTPRILGGATGPKILVQTPEGMRAIDNPAYVPDPANPRFQLHGVDSRNLTIFDPSTGRYATPANPGYVPKGPTVGDRQYQERTATEDYEASPDAEESRLHYQATERIKALGQIDPAYRNRPAEEVISELEAAAAAVVPDRATNPDAHAAASAQVRQAQGRLKRIESAVKAADDTAERQYKALVRREAAKRGGFGDSGADDGAARAMAAIDAAESRGQITPEDAEQRRAAVRARAGGR